MTDLGKKNKTTKKKMDELIISEESIYRLSQAFEPLLKDSIWVILSSFAVLGAAGFAAYSVIQQGKVAKASLLNSIHERFFEINLKFLEHEGRGLTRSHKELLGNYFHYVAWQVKNRRIYIRDIELLRTEMINRFESFGEEYRKLHGNYFFDNWSWLVEELRKKKS